MAEFLVIRLRAAARTPPSWVTVNHEGARLSGVEKGSLELAARGVESRRVVVLVPATEVLMTSADLPVRGGAKVLQALPFALEEQLAEDIDKLHFAPGVRSEGAQGLPVAVTTRSNMDQWLERLASAGIRPQLMMPDAYGLPPEPGGVSVLLDRDLVYLRRGADQPIVFQGLRLDQALELAGIGVEGAATPAAATRLTVFLGQRRHQGQSELWNDLRERFADVEIRLLPQGPLPHLAVNAVRFPDVNLLQGPYAPVTSSQALWQPWRLAASLAAVCVAVALGVEAVQFFKLSAEEARLDATIEQVFHSALPNVPLSTDPRRQLERELEAARGGTGAGERPFLEILSVVGSVLRETPDARVEALSFRNDTMDLRLTVPSVGTLDQIKRLVAERGQLDTEIRSANPRDEAIEGRLTLKEPEA
ncbi:MAG TPA: type II secretion system protein GspL [Gammaproteobacteria bacterium]|nr:type II secretion system protein GspL [Gammaproteobacteria bacterium]